MDAIKTFIGEHRPWLVGAGFLMVLYLYQARPFDKEADEAANHLKNTAVGTWWVTGYQPMGSGAAFRNSKSKASVAKFYEIHQDGSYVTKNGSKITNNGKWEISKAHFSQPNLNSFYRNNKALGKVHTIKFSGGADTCHVVSFSKNEIICETKTKVGGLRWTLSRFANR